MYDDKKKIAKTVDVRKQQMNAKNRLMKKSSGHNMNENKRMNKKRKTTE